MRRAGLCLGDTYKASSTPSRATRGRERAGVPCRSEGSSWQRQRSCRLVLCATSAIRGVMMYDAFTHEVGDDPVPRRRVRISGPVYDDSSVPLLRVEYEDGDAELMRPSDMRLFLPLSHQRPRPSSSMRAPVPTKCKTPFANIHRRNSQQRRTTSSCRGTP
jgi:hypothetical protein